MNDLSFILNFFEKKKISKQHIAYLSSNCSYYDSRKIKFGDFFYLKTHLTQEFPQITNIPWKNLFMTSNNSKTNKKPHNQTETKNILMLRSIISGRQEDQIIFRWDSHHWMKAINTKMNVFHYWNRHQSRLSLCIIKFRSLSFLSLKTWIKK